MRTPLEESTPGVRDENHTPAQSYLPSPPETPQNDQRRSEYFEDGMDDNTATGMAESQEQSMYPREEEHGSDNLCACETKDLTTQAFVEDSINLTIESGSLQSQSSIGLHEETNPQQSCEEPAMTPVASSDKYIVSLPQQTQQTPVTNSRTNIPTALFSPSPPPTSSSNDPVPVSILLESASVDCLASDFSKVRLTPSFTSSFFRPGSRFTGTQQSDRQIYNVDVEINNVSIPDSSVSGYLKICGLTDTHPTLTTYFEGEIIGTRHTFQTRHPGWGATDKTDMQHWARFPAWRPLAKEARRPGFSFGKGWWNRENIFMRWKEHFLVPDHRVRSIQGASFEGFYYICYNQVEGRISGIYFHAKSEK